MIFFCRKAATADGRVRWAVCVPTFLGFITIAWFYSAELAAAFADRLEHDEPSRCLAEEDAWREFLFRVDLFWNGKLQKDREDLLPHHEGLRALLCDYNDAIARLLRECAPDEHARRFRDVWDASFDAMSARGNGMEDLAALLRAQQRVFSSLLADITARAGITTAPEGARLQ
ncbi:hypothetical protein [uncultured Desulfovibrio sp.]|uniref:hypothetical protein n=1 Tax=uncultured Desulfovibrio sp. TaxID=167968 RepID=UPI00260EE175|nr:hypothetical protein [uncultured Desulfovibrio sp.]